MQSRFIITYRLLPTTSFKGLDIKIAVGDDHEVLFKDNLVWVSFDADPKDWVRQLSIATQGLRTILSTLALQVEYSFDLELVQWLEDKAREQADSAAYVLGRLGPDLTVQAEPPSIQADHIRKSEIYVRLAALNPFYRYSLLDYSVALTFPQESVVFSARSVEWAEKYFSAQKEATKNLTKLDARSLLRKRLDLPTKYVTEFFKIANQTVIARHAGDPSKIRPPTIEELRFCVFFARTVIDRFGGYLWYEHSALLPDPWKWPADEGTPERKFEAAKKTLNATLRALLAGT